MFCVLSVSSARLVGRRPFLIHEDPLVLLAVTYVV